MSSVTLRNVHLMFQNPVSSVTLRNLLL